MNFCSAEPFQKKRPDRWDERRPSGDEHSVDVGKTESGLGNRGIHGLSYRCEVVSDPGLEIRPTNDSVDFDPCAGESEMRLGLDR